MKSRTLLKSNLFHWLITRNFKTFWIFTLDKRIKNSWLTSCGCENLSPSIFRIIMDNDIFSDILCAILSKCPSLNNKSSKNDYFCFFRIGYTNIYHMNMQNLEHNQILSFVQYQPTPYTYAQKYSVCHWGPQAYLISPTNSLTAQNAQEFRAVKQTFASFTA